MSFLFFIREFQDYDYCGGNKRYGVGCDNCDIRFIDAMDYPGRRRPHYYQKSKKRYVFRFFRFKRFNGLRDKLYGA